MGRRPQPQRRAALLGLCADDLLANGLAGSTLARLAAGAGTSPRMLIYHFRTRDRLVKEALLAARQRQRTPTAGWLAALDLLELRTDD
jgi:AcrR family transcriptional regulator